MLFRSRAGLRPADLDRDIAQRARYLDGLVGRGILAAADVRTAIERFGTAHDGGPRRAAFDGPLDRA